MNLTIRQIKAQLMMKVANQTVVGMKEPPQDLRRQVLELELLQWFPKDPINLQVRHLEEDQDLQCQWDLQTK